MAGGGVLLNDHPAMAGIETVCQAHVRSGTTSLLATLITDSEAVTRRALEAGQQAARQGIPGFLGLHLEGPHLAAARRGAHDPALIRPMTEDHLGQLTEAAKNLPVLLTTVAPETVTCRQMRQLQLKPESSLVWAIRMHRMNRRRTLPRPVPRWSRISLMR